MKSISNGGGDCNVKTWAILKRFTAAVGGRVSSMVVDEYDAWLVFLFWPKTMHVIQREFAQLRTCNSDRDDRYD